MSRARITTICMLATTLAVSVGCLAQSPKVIAQKLYDQMNQAEADHDLNRLLGFFDLSYVDTDAHQKRVAFPEYRRQMEQIFPLLRRINPRTTVEDVQVEAGRMVVYYTYKSHYEFHHQPGEYGWRPQIHEESGEETWERKGGEWKLVRGTTLRAVTQVDPAWQKAVDDLEEEAAKPPCTDARRKKGLCD